MQDSPLCGETHGMDERSIAYLCFRHGLQGKTMKTLTTDPALVMSWLLALAGMPQPVLTPAPTAAPAPRQDA
jgi:hypothetical protein